MQPLTIQTYVRPPKSIHTIVDLLRWHAEQRPQNEAYSFLVDGEKNEVAFTYRELDERARSFAVSLSALASHRDHVLINLPPGLDYIAAFFGILYAGMVPVPSPYLRPNQGLNQLQTFVAAAEATSIISTSAVIQRIGVEGRSDQRLNGLGRVNVDQLESSSILAWQEPSIETDSLAALLLTSGTTGVPKGVMVTHANFLSNMESSEPIFHLGAGDHVVSWMPQHASMSVLLTLLCPLYAGCTATVMSPQAFLEKPLRWLEAMSRSKATHTPASNFAFDLCVQTVTPEERESLDLSNWKAAFNGGEYVRAETLQRFTESFAPCGFRAEAFTPCYGLSESMILSMKPDQTRPVVRAISSRGLERGEVVLLREADGDGKRIVSCGHLVPGQPIHIVDPHSLLPCPPGRVGEVWASGNSIAQGYWKRPMETEETFGAHLASGEGPFLRTGDLGFLDDGELFITGRLKELLIIRGRNLSPEAIEAVVSGSHDGLRFGGCAAFAIEVDDEERLVVVQEVEPETEELDQVIRTIRRAVASRHEIQVYGVVLIPAGTLPKTGSGKIQRGPCQQAWREGRLPVVLEHIGAGEVTGIWAEPQTSAERILCRVWEEVLGIAPIGTEDNFFELGGDSLLSMRIIARAQQEEIYFNVQQLVAHPTVRALARVVSTEQSVRAEQGLVAGAVPLTPTQRHFFEDVPEHHEWYGGPYFIEIPSVLNPELLGQAIRHLLTHHDALRMRFWREGDEWIQWNADAEDHDVFCAVDLSGLSEDEAQKRRGEAVWKAREAINLEHGPLLQAVYVHGQPDASTLLVIRLHHLVMDAFSLSIWFEDLSTAYEQLVRGEQMQLPAKTTSFKTWAERLQTYATREEIVAETAYWLADSRKVVPPLPVDFHGDSGTDGMSHQVGVALGVEETQRLLRKVPAVYGTDVADVLLTALTVGVTQWTGKRSLLIELFTHGRDPLFDDHDIDLSHTMGWLTSMFPMLLTLDDAQTPGQELLEIKRQMRSIPNRGLGYGILRHLASPQIGERLRSMPQPEVNLNYTGYIDPIAGHAPGSAFAGAAMVRRRGPMGGAASRPLTVWSQVREHQLHLDFQYREDLHRETTIQSVAASCLSWLQQLLAVTELPQHVRTR